MTRHSLPRRFPVFPLPNAVLFPDVLLPLHAFEPRYRAMARAAIDGDRVIGMLLLRPGVDALHPEAPVFDVGCAGRITECQRLPDGRWNFVLRGERRFRVCSLELAARGFRIAEADPLDDPTWEELAEAPRCALAADRVRLERTMLEYASLTSPDTLELLAERMSALDPLQLVHALAFALDCEPLEKQGLLEAPDAVARGRLLAQLLEFRKAAQRLPDPPRNVN